MERVDHLLPIEKIKPNPRNARNHSRAQIRQIAESIQSIGFGAPLLVDENHVLIAGHGRWAAGELLKLEVVPVVELRGLSEAQKRALALADNKLCENAGWNREQLAIELPELAELLV
jgi:ParB-like chromosome segregation protein Spo0J